MDYDKIIYHDKNIPKVYNNTNDTIDNKEIIINNTKIKSRSNLEVHTINVGQSDSTLVITPDNSKILIDTGHELNSSGYIIEYLDRNDFNKIDKLILTHNDWDHIGGVSEIINEYTKKNKSIKHIYTNGIKNNKKISIYNRKMTVPTYSYIKMRYYTAINGYNIRELNSGDYINYTMTTLRVINPDENDNTVDVTNENSLVIRIEYEDTSYLITGDIEDKSEKRIVKNESNINSDIIQSSHHGSKTSNSKEFISKVDPSTAIISSAYNSQWNHPHNKTLNTFNNASIRTYWTGVHGSIVSVSDEKSWYSINQDNETTDPKSIKKADQVSIPPYSGYN